MNNIKDGDIFNWKYRNHTEYCEKLRGSGTAYWCMDQQCYATIRDGVTYLVDTYWSDYGSEYLGNRSRILDLDKVDLEFVCNLNEIEWISEYYIQDYDKVYNLSRQKNCYKKYAIDKDAQPSNKALLAKYKRNLETAFYDKQSAEHRIETLIKDIAELEKQE